MNKYTDGYIFPIARKYLDEYQQVAQEVARIWKAHGALHYCEHVGDTLNFEGTRSFNEVANVEPDEVVIFGWVEFPSKEIRDQAHKSVRADATMNKLVAPLMDPNRLVFDPSRMVFGGFNPLVQ